MKIAIAADHERFELKQRMNELKLKVLDVRPELD